MRQCVKAGWWIAAVLALTCGCSASDEDDGPQLIGGEPPPMGTTTADPGNPLPNPSSSSSGGGFDITMNEPPPMAGDECGSVELQADVEEIITPGNVLVVFDRSLSMINWVQASDALVAALGPNMNALTIGALFFPSTSATDPSAGTDNYCDSMVMPMADPGQIGFLPGQQFIDAWAQSWASGALYGGTPLDQAMVIADDVLFNSNLQNETVVIVVTDGEPTCRPPAGSNLLAEELATKWLGLGIRTYVLGVTGLTFGFGGGNAILNGIAMAGGTGQFIPPTDFATLEREIANITSTVVTRTLDACAITLDPPPPNLDEVHLAATEAATGTEYEVPVGPDNWALASDGTSATLLGRFCEDAKAGVFTSVRFSFGCVELPVLPPR